MSRPCRPNPPSQPHINGSASPVVLQGAIFRCWISGRTLADPLNRVSLETRGKGCGQLLTCEVEGPRNLCSVREAFFGLRIQ